MLKTFRLLSLIEGASLITLICIAMPAKYTLGYFDIIWPVGMTHGVLWLAYLCLSLVVSHQQRWSAAFWGITVAASITPFACFWMDNKLQQAPVPAKVT